VIKVRLKIYSAHLLWLEIVSTVMGGIKYNHYSSLAQSSASFVTSIRIAHNAAHHVRRLFFAPTPPL